MTIFEDFQADGKFDRVEEHKNGWVAFGRHRSCRFGYNGQPTAAGARIPPSFSFFRECNINVTKIFGLPFE